MRLSIKNMKFSKMAQSIFSATSNSILKVKGCQFTNSITPVRYSSIDRTKFKPLTTRRVVKNAPLKFDSNLFDFCQSKDQNGGAIYASGTSLAIVNCEFVSCLSLRGGGVYITSGHISISGSSFYQCVAMIYGGAVMADGSNFFCTKTYFVANKAEANYGAFFQSVGKVTISEISVYENVANRGYGGCGFNQTTGTITNSFFIDNLSPAEEGGTAMFVESTTDYFQLERCKFAGNREFFFKYRLSSQTRLLECCFSSAEANTFTTIGPKNNDQDIMMHPLIGPNNYEGSCEPPPKLPARFHKEIFFHGEVAPQIEWWKLYAGLAIFIVLVASMAFTIPAVFFPLAVRGAARRGDSKNAML